MLAARYSDWIVAHGSGREGNSPHCHAHEPALPFAGPLPDPLVPVTVRSFVGSNGLAAMRAFVNGWASLEQLAPERTSQLVLAVNELATNSIRYGGGAGCLCVWREADTLMCEIRDNGLIQEPLAGSRCPAPEALSGRGLWLVNQLCDLVQIRSSQTGTTVRVHMSLAN